MAMATAQPADRTRQRQEVVRREILAAASRLATERGWEGLSLKELGAAVGMRAPSLYSYFPGKAAILDALFAEGYRQMDAVVDAAVAEVDPQAPPRERLEHVLSAWLAFCQADPARYRLMMTSAIPHWSPSEEAYAASLSSYQRMADYLAPIGFTPGPRLDLFTAVTAGLASQQLANDPGGDRWTRLLPVLVDMLLDQLPHIPEEVR
jgi:AcrR family transcriptional regulator